MSIDVPGVYFAKSVLARHINTVTALLHRFLMTATGIDFYLWRTMNLPALDKDREPATLEYCLQDYSDGGSAREL